MTVIAIAAGGGVAALAVSGRIPTFVDEPHLPLLGPTLLLANSAPHNRLAGGCAVVLLLAAMLSPLIRVHWATVALAVGAALLWVFIGVAASGISC